MTKNFNHASLAPLYHILQIKALDAHGYVAYFHS